VAVASARASGGESPRRRGRGGDPPRKVGWQVSASVAEAVREAVEQGAAASQNAFVEDALVRRLKELRRERVYSAYAAAAKDQAFVEDMRRAGESFDAAVRDGLEARR
jgi:hypothetical protein